MKSLHLRFSTLAFTVCGLFVHGVASAQTSDCATDDDCEHGYTCQVTGSGGCGMAAPCRAGEACDPIACDPYVVKSCEPATGCDDDSDCADGMLCHAEQTNCAMAACPPGEPCDPIPCEATTSTSCVYPSSLPCHEAADCGEGYECAVAACACGGMAVAPSAPATSAPVSSGEAKPALAAPPGSVAPPPTTTAVPPDGNMVPPQDCACEPSDVGYCQAKTIECTDDSQCPADWTCQIYAQGTASGGVAMGEPTPATSTTSFAAPATTAPAPDAPSEAPPAYDGGAGAPVPILPPRPDDVPPAADAGSADVSPTGYCMPPGGGMVAIPGSTPGTPGPTETGGTVGTPVSPVEPPVFDAGAPEPVDPTQPGTKPPVTQNPPPDATGTEPTPTGKPPVTPPKPGDDTHNGGSKGNPEDADAGAGETTTPGNGLEDDQPSNGDDGGCAVAAAPRSGSSSTTWLLGLVGLALLRRRR